MTDLIHFVRFLYTYKHLRGDGGGGGWSCAGGEGPGVTRSYLSFFLQQFDFSASLNF